MPRRRSDDDDDAPTHASVSVRKIDNGYISTHTREEGGDYSHEERYHSSRPSAEELLRKRRAPPKVNHMRAAVAQLKRGR